MATSEPEPEAVSYSRSLDDARDALASEGAVIAVLGDSTGVGPDDWVHLWVEEHLRRARDVAYTRWDVAEGEWFEDIGDVDAVQVWNGSISGDRADLARERVSTLPEGADLVLLNYGHNHTPSDAATVGDLAVAVSEHAADAALVVLLQQPQVGDANAAVREAVGRAAQERGVPVIDVADAFAQDGRDLSELLMDNVHPDEDGSRVWAEAVARALG